MPAFCPLCAQDEHTTTAKTDDGITFAVCTDRSHGDAGYTWELSSPTSRANYRSVGLASELGLWDKLLDCVPPGEEFVPYGDVEDALFEKYSQEAETLMQKYGHRWREPAKRSSGYSMSTYVAHRLGDLEKEQLLDQKKGPGTGASASNATISYWRLSP